jgi:hypothetical protein
MFTAKARRKAKWVGLREGAILVEIMVLPSFAAFAVKGVESTFYQLGGLH